MFTQNSLLVELIVFLNNVHSTKYLIIKEFSNERTISKVNKREFFFIFCVLKLLSQSSLHLAEEWAESGQLLSVFTAWTLLRFKAIIKKKKETTRFNRNNFGSIQNHLIFIQNIKSKVKKNWPLIIFFI